MIDSNHSANPPISRNPLATVACVSSLLFFCPLTTVLAIVLGGMAVIRSSRLPGQPGRRRALAAMVVGGMFTMVQIGAVYAGLHRMRSMGELPAAMLQRGMRGDLATFRNGFGPVGREVSEAETRTFLDAVADRYGEPTGSMAPLHVIWSSARGGQDSMALEWTLHFADDSRVLTGELRRSPHDSGASYFARMTIHDPHHGDLTYPPAVSSTPAPVDEPLRNEDAADHDG